MGKIFYSLAGEGRGHATRARAVVEALKETHAIRVYAPELAYDFLADVYRNTDVEVRRIAGLCLQYSATHTVHYLHTARDVLRYIAQMPQAIRRLQREIEHEQPDLAITDFEPLLPRAAKQCSLPFISLNHQHLLVASDLGALPMPLQRQAALMACVVRSYYRGQQQTLVSSFYSPPLKRGFEQVRQIGVLLQPEVIQCTPQTRPHIVAYLRRFASPPVLAALRRIGREVRIYGLGAHARQGNLSFMPIDDKRFMEDLVTSSALVCTAGNQLVGEALYLGKPVLAMPEPGNAEQAINAFYLQQSGDGMSVEMPAMTVHHLRYLLDHAGQFTRNGLDRQRLYGNTAALKVIHTHLPSDDNRHNPAHALL